MATLAAIKRQIAEFEAEAARISKVEAAAAIEKTEPMTASSELTVEHLGMGSGAGKGMAPRRGSRRPSGR